MGKDEKAVFTCLADETLVATAEKMKKKGMVERTLVGIEGLKLTYCRGESSLHR